MPTDAAQINTPAPSCLRSQYNYVDICNGAHFPQTKIQLPSIGAKQLAPLLDFAVICCSYDLLEWFRYGVAGLSFWDSQASGEFRVMVWKNAENEHEALQSAHVAAATSVLMRSSDSLRCSRRADPCCRVYARESHNVNPFRKPAPNSALKSGSQTGRFRQLLLGQA